MIAIEAGYYSVVPGFYWWQSCQLPVFVHFPKVCVWVAKLPGYILIPYRITPATSSISAIPMLCLIS